MAGLYPDQEVASKFSINNPMARFSIKPNAMRETIMAYQKLGKDVASKALAKANPTLRTNLAKA